MPILQDFDEIWLVDFEFSAPAGERPSVVCMVAQEYMTGRTIRLWEDDLNKMDKPPFSQSRDVLYVAFYASAEMGCHLALGWPMPDNVLDLFVEFKNMNNGISLPCGFGLLGALAYFGINTVEALEKNEMRELALRGGPWTSDEKKALLDYCQSDVLALERLLPKMAPNIDIGRALVRGRYMKAAARIEHNGVPIDVETFKRFKESWHHIQNDLIRKIDTDYGVFEGRTFKRDKFKQWLIREDIPWPLLPSGEICLRDETFKEMAGSYPKISPLRELRHALSRMRLSELAVGKDGRNRCLLSVFSARTGRNQPSTSRFIFGPSTWLRGLIKPPEGHGLAYVDWSQQEFAIAASLSNDPLMKEAYLSGDPYLEFAKQAGAVPSDGTKTSHPHERSLFKQCVLATQYGMGAESLAKRIAKPVAIARELLELHHKTYKMFWEWSDGCLDYAMLYGELWTAFGWTIHVGGTTNPRSLCNFPMQANGAEMLRLACCFATEQGITVCAPVHDAILIEAPLDELDETIKRTQAIMQEAGEIVLNGFQLRTDVDIVRHPDRYMDERGMRMWNIVEEILAHKASNLPQNGAGSVAGI